MILYNITIKIDHDAHQEWLQWMKDIHIPDMMATGMFLEYRMCKLLGMDEEDGLTYAIQYFCTDMPTFEQYQKKFAPALQKEHADKFGGKFIAFRTLLEVINKGAFYTSN